MRKQSLSHFKTEIYKNYMAPFKKHIKEQIENELINIRDNLNLTSDITLYHDVWEVHSGNNLKNAIILRGRDTSSPYYTENLGHLIKMINQYIKYDRTISWYLGYINTMATSGQDMFKAIPTYYHQYLPGKYEEGKHQNDLTDTEAYEILNELQVFRLIWSSNG